MRHASWCSSAGSQRKHVSRSRNRSRGRSVSGRTRTSPRSPWGPSPPPPAMSGAPGTSVTSDLTDPGALEEVLHRVRRLRPLLDPRGGLVRLDLEQRRIGHRIVVGDDLDEPPVASGAGVRHHHAICRLLGRARPSQSNVYRHVITSVAGGYRLRNGSAPLSLPIRPSICLRPFIIFLSCALCLRSRLTSATWVPLPRAIRSRRLPLMSAGVSRAAGVSEAMMAS